MTALSLILISVLLLAPGLFLRPKSAEFFLAAQRCGSLAVGSSLLATCLGASAILGIVARAYDFGWWAFCWLGAGSLGLVLLSFFWTSSMRSRADVKTLPQWLEVAYGLPARQLAASLIVIMWTGVIAAQLTAAGAIIGTITGWSIGTGIILTAIAVASYTSWGGQSSVLRTDKVQILLIAAAVSIPLIALAVTGKINFTQISFNNSPTPNPVSSLQLLSLIVVVGGMYIVGPDICSRVLTAKNRKNAQRAALGAGLVLLPISAAIVIIGLSLSHLAPDLENSQEALPWLISESGLFPSKIGLFVNTGLLAAMLSSADTCLITAASVLELDLIGRRHSAEKQQLLGRLAVVMIAAVSTVVAIYHPKIIANILLAYSFYTGGLLAPLLLLRWPKLVQSIPRTWVWTAILTGGFLPILLLLTGKVADSATAGMAGVLLSTTVMLTGWLKYRISSQNHCINRD